MKKVSFLLKFFFVCNIIFNNVKKILGVYAFATKDDVDNYFEQHRNNRDFAVIFENYGNDDKVVRLENCMLILNVYVLFM